MATRCGVVHRFPCELFGRGESLPFPWSRIRRIGAAPVVVVLRGGGEGGGGEGGDYGEMQEEDEEKQQEGFRMAVEARYKELIRGAGEVGGGGTRFDALGEPPICGDGDFSVDMDQVVKELGDDLVKDLGEVMARGWPKAGPYTAYHEAMMEELQEGVREAGGEDELPDSGPDDDEAVEALLRQVTKTQDSLIKTRDSFTKTRDSFTKTQDSFDRFIR